MLSDDDAFIRTIVDSPGRDLPRLVYADWLDDRNDPRGPFLRAEVEWAQPWKEGIRPGDDAELRAMATGLDPLWVARVSRPPVGVCCDHIKWNESGPQLDSAELEHAQHRLGMNFPSAFLGFLLNYNGGDPSPACLPYPPSLGWDDSDMEIRSFFTASRRAWPLPEARCFTWEFQVEGELEFLHSLYRDGEGTEQNPLLAGLIPIADTTHDLSYLFVSVSPEHIGCVYRFGDYCHNTNDPGHLSLYCDSLGELLSLLREDRFR